jgi:hypothetical protein
LFHCIREFPESRDFTWHFDYLSKKPEASDGGKAQEETPGNLPVKAALSLASGIPLAHSAAVAWA